MRKEAWRKADRLLRDSATQAGSVNLELPGSDLRKIHTIMARQSSRTWILVLLVSLALVIDVSDAGWKFWKNKKDKDNTSSESPLIEVSSTTTTTTLAPTTATTNDLKVSTTPSSSWKFWKKNKDKDASSTVAPSSLPSTTAASGLRNKVLTTPASANRGVAAAADPALAIGVGNSGGKIREDARNQPRKPSPGTDVGLDIGQPKPVRSGLGPGVSGQGYRDWAADLTGAGDPTKPKPKLPEQGPALSAGGTQPNQGNRPTSAPGYPNAPAVTPGNRPASAPNSPAVGQKPLPGAGAKEPAASPIPSSTSRPLPTTPSPKAKPTLILPTQPSAQGYPPLNPGIGGASPPASPSGGKSWADVAGGGSRPGSPTPAPKTVLATSTARPGSPIVAQKRGEQRPFENPSLSQTTKRPGISPGAAVGAGGLALAGGAAAGAAIANSGKTYSSNPTYSKGKGVTDEDLEKLAEALFIKDVNNANKYIKLNLQKTTSGSNPKDEAPQPLLEVKPEAFQIPTIQKVLSIYDNYKLDTRENEYISPAQRQEESVLIDTFLSTNVMAAAMRFLADKGFVKKDYYDYKDTLRTLWFNLYSRGEGKIGSTGFEHVFLTELKLGTELSGLHNWIYFNAEEVKNRLDYLGYIKKVDLGDKAAIVKTHVKFNGIDKPVTNVFIGTSPELEMALYTVCFFARPDAKCPVSLGGTKFDIQTYKFRYRGRDLIGSAYPEI